MKRNGVLTLLYKQR